MDLIVNGWDEYHIDYVYIFKKYILVIVNGWDSLWMG